MVVKHTQELTKKQKNKFSGGTIVKLQHMLYHLLVVYRCSHL